jgi:serine/threonine protein kinase
LFSSVCWLLQRKALALSQARTQKRSMFGGRATLALKDYAASDPLLDEYEIGERLGQGSHATVYTSRHKPSGRAVAIKVVNKTMRMRDRVKALEALKRESSVM